MSTAGSRACDRALVALATVALAACSGSSTGAGAADAGPLDAPAFGAKYRLAEEDVPGWRPTTDPNDPFAFGVYDETTLSDRIDGGNMAYLSRGCRLAMYQDLVGPEPMIATVVAMDFVTAANATTMFAYEKEQNAATTVIPSFDGETAIGKSVPTGLTAYAHVAASYFEVQLDGVPDQTAAATTASQLLQAMGRKTE